jgi:hypothetical protein
LEWQNRNSISTKPEHTFLLLPSVPVLSASVPLSLVQLPVAAAAVSQIPVVGGVLVLVWNFNYIHTKINIASFKVKNC